MDKSGLVKQLGFFVPTMCEKFVTLVERGELRLEHDGVLLQEAQPAGVGARVVAWHPGQRPPPQGVLPAFIFQFPNVTSQAGFDSLRTVCKVGLVVSVPDFPRCGRDPRVGLVRLALLHQSGLVHVRGILAPGIDHWALGRPTTTVAVRVEWPLHRQIVAVVGHQLGVVSRNDLG